MSNSKLKQDLIKLLGKEKVLSQDLDLLYYSYDSSFLTKLEPARPDAVVFPKSTEDVQKVVSYAYQNRINIIPRGAGTGETGGCIAIQGGIVLDLSTWKEIIEIDVNNMQVIVSPGVVHAELNDELAKFNLFFPLIQAAARCVQ